MTALLSSEKDNTDKVVQYIDECKRMGIEVLPPDVNESFPSFTVVGERSIRFGLAAVKNVGQAAIDSVIQNRIKTGPFKSLHDFCERVDSRAVNRKTIESLIKCGAFDTLGFRRSQLMDGLDSAVAHASQLQKDRQAGQFSLFDSAAGSRASPKTAGSLRDLDEWPEAERLAYEKELLGYYVTGHPLRRYEKELHQYSSVNALTVLDAQDGSEVLYGALVAKLRLTVTKKSGERMAILGLEDLEGLVEALVFPRVYAEYGHLLAADAILFFKGRLDKSEEMPKLVVQEIHTVQSIQNRMTRSVLIEFGPEAASETNLHAVQELLSRHGGQTPVYLNFVKPTGERTEMIIDRSLYVSPNADLVDAVEAVLGAGSIRLQV
ncbi:MAG: hypothetical protein HQL11_00305 [Candidatus Omnitrophica bacterium]|nr:hypothetical protein [Candidatus Omnitrophota bacterium]